MRRPPFIAMAMGLLLLIPALAGGTSSSLGDVNLDAGGPTVTVTGIGVPGKLVVIDGRGFRPHSVYQVFWDSSTPIRFVWPSARGTFHGHLRIPTKARDGSHVVTFALTSRATATSTVKGTLVLTAGVREPAGLRVQVRVRRVGSAGANNANVAAPTPGSIGTATSPPGTSTDPTPTPGQTSPPGPTPVPTATPAPGATGLYGSGLNFDTKANLQVGWTDRARVAHRFTAGTTSALKSIRFQQRGGAIYSGGTGGTLQITVQTDGPSGPTGTVLATATYTPGNPSGEWTTYDAVTFSAPPTLTEGTRYDIVFDDIDADPVANYISVNELFVYGAKLTPRQPAFSDAEYAVLAATSGGWSVQGNYTADMDLTYADGSHDGMAYVQNMTEYYGTISGNASVREHFTVSGGNRTVSSASVRVRRSGGSSPLTIGLETGSGSLIEAVDVPASSVPVSAAGGDNGGSVWVTVTFAAPHNLANGTTYNLRLTTASGTTYTAAPIREGTDVGLQSYAFRDGSGQGSSNGTSWADLYAYSPVDLQFYFR